MTSDAEWDPSLFDEDYDEFAETSDLENEDLDFEYSEEFTPHEINVYSCIQNAHYDIKINKTKVTFNTSKRVMLLMQFHLIFHQFQHQNHPISTSVEP